MVNKNLPFPDAAAGLPPERRIALAMTPKRLRGALSAVLMIDARLGEIIAQAREPLLAQMRLAWWREQLERPTQMSPTGEPLLEFLACNWAGSTDALAKLVDGWEELLGDAPLEERSIARFATGRGAMFAALCVEAGSECEVAQRAGERWAFADFAFRTSHPEEREAALRLGSALPPPARHPRLLRGVAVLDGLAAIAIARKEPLMHGRGAALHAIRLGMFGR